MQYVSKEVHNTQLLNLLNVMNQNPDLREHVHTDKLVSPIFRAFSLEPEGIVMTAEEKQAKDQEQQQMAQQAIMVEMEAKTGMMKDQAMLQEKMAVSSDQRKQEIGEREELMKQGNTLTTPPVFEEDSILIREEKEEELQEQMMQELQGQQADSDLDQIEQGLSEEDGVAPV